MNNHNINHIGFILDGNRRWAKEKGLPSLEGHRQGSKVFKSLCQWCFDRDINTVTVFAFSTENWKRAQEEVGYLMNLLREFLKNEVQELIDKKIKLRFIGRRDKMDSDILELMDKAESETEDYTKGVLQIALNYGGRPEIVDATKAIVANGHKPEDIDESLIESYLYTHGAPDPDIIVRTSGEYRLSGFLLWQSAYSELFFIKKYWPDFSEADLDEIIKEYEMRERRYGK